MAVVPPPDIVDALDRTLDAVRGLPGAPRWMAPESWHVTLAFLGEVPGSQIAGLLSALGPVVAGAPPMTLQLGGAGRFGRPRPRVLWAGVAGDVEALAVVADRLAAAARHAGVPVDERPYQPHLTLGRWPGTGDADPAMVDRLGGEHGRAWSVAEVVVWRSRPGAGYQRLAGWPTHHA